MKRLIQASLFLLACSAFIIASQISCKKSSAQTTTSAPNGGLILLAKSVQVPGTPSTDTGVVSQTTVWVEQYSLANLDGSNFHQIPITPPAGLFVGGSAHLTHNGQTLVFQMFSQNQTIQAIYSCAIDGSNLQKVMDLPSASQLQDVY